MSNNYDYYNNGKYRNNRNYYQNKYYQYDQKKKMYLNSNNNSNIKIREVEIKTMDQTTPAKNKDIDIQSNNEKSTANATSSNINNNMDQSANEESILNFKRELLGNNEEFFSCKDVNEQFKSILNKLEELNIEKKISDITNDLNEKSNQIKKETIDTLKEIKESLETKMDKIIERNNSELAEIKSLYNWQCLTDLRKQLNNLKGSVYSKPIEINSLYDFQVFFYSILSEDLKKSFQSTQSLQDIINEIYCSIRDNDDTDISYEEEFWYIVNFFHNNNKKDKKILKLNLSGNIYRIIKHFRGAQDEIIIDFGDIIPFINSIDNINKSKSKIVTVTKLLNEILCRLCKANEISDKIYAFGHIFYGLKNKGVEIKEFNDNNVYFNFIELK